jgi:uncharacterized membrane protein YdbT with pleckstrin-like domain
MSKRRVSIQQLNEQIQQAEYADEQAKVLQLRTQLKEQRDMQLKHMVARDELRHRIADETDEEIAKADEAKKREGGKWKSKLQVFAAVIGPVVALVVQVVFPLAGVQL